MLDNTSKMEQFVEAEVKRFARIIREKNNIILPFLRFHLLTENLLERIIRCHLAKANRFLHKTKAHRWYNDKLCLVDSFNILDERTMGAIKSLNSLRNRLAHNIKASISLEGLDEIGNHFGKEYKELRREYLNDIRELMVCVFELILFRLIPKVYHLEHDTRAVNDSSL